MLIWIVFIGIAIISYLVQANLKSKFEKYSQMPLTNGMTGKEVAEKMLRDNGIYDVTVTSTSGMLTDHYNPMNKTCKCGCCGSGCSRVRTCGTACAGICAFAYAFGFGPGSTVLFFHRILGVVGRYNNVTIFSAAAAYRYLSVCHDHVVQFHYPSSRN